MFFYRVLFVLMVYVIFCADSKGSGYIFNNKFARVIDGNSSWLKLDYFHFGRYNRSVKAASFKLTINMNVTREDDVMLYFGFSILKNNEFKKTPIRFPKKLCDILGTKNFDLPNISKNSTFQKCPLLKGPHYAYNIMLTSNGWPKLLPEGTFLLNVDFFYRDVNIIKLEWLLEIIAV